MKAGTLTSGTRAKGAAAAKNRVERAITASARRRSPAPVSMDVRDGDPDSTGLLAASTAEPVLRCMEEFFQNSVWSVRILSGFDVVQNHSMTSVCTSPA